MKSEHEFRDPIHGFITCSSMERKVIDSGPFQRLRHIHQLAMTFLVYPGATHKRFEHSLGVMELASRVFDVLTKEDNWQQLPEEVKQNIPELNEKQSLGLWRLTVRMAALCHDMGHLPFSHATEGMLPDKTTHEHMTWKIVTENEQMLELWKALRIEPTTVAKLAVGQKELPDGCEPLTTWENLLSEIVVDDAFGVDRMDYLLRDSHHLGVSYGQFDHKRLIHSLRIGFSPQASSDEGDQSFEPHIGIERGGLHAAAALLWARYSIFSQVYFHHIRRVYDLHLGDFIKACYPSGYSLDLNDYLALTDNEILANLYKATRSKEAFGEIAHATAGILVQRQHFRCVYHQTTAHRQRNVDAVSEIFRDLCSHFGADRLKLDIGMKKKTEIDFPVMRDGAPGAPLQASQEIPSINLVPNVETGYIFASPTIKDSVKKYLGSHIDTILDA